jgi:hypothetical protein
MLRGMVIMAIKSKGGVVTLVNALLASEMSCVSKSESRYGLSAG